MLTIHQRIKQKRLELELSRVELGKAVGVTQQAVYNWEEEEAVPADHRLKRIAMVLKTTPDWLSNGIDASLPISIAAHYILIPLLGTERRDRGGIDVQNHEEVGDLTDDSNSYAYRRDFLAEMGVRPEWLRVFMAADHNMNLGQQLLVDLQQNQIEDGRVYLLETPAGHQVRRLYIQIDGSVRVRADNRDVPEQVVAPEAINVVGRVISHQGTV